MMTESEFLALAPRERDALVAEAFEPKPRLVPEMDPFDDYIWSEGGLWYAACFYENDDRPAWYPTGLTQHIGPAWKVVEKFGWFQLIHNKAMGGMWRCEFDEVRVYADTAPLATCLAA